MPVENEANESLPRERIADIPGLDIFGTDPYWYLHNRDYREYVSAQMQRAIQVCTPRDLTPYFWAQGFGIPAGREDELETGLNLAVALGAQSVAVWGMHGPAAYDGACGNPELVWDLVGKTFGEIRGIL